MVAMEGSFLDFYINNDPEKSRSLSIDESQALYLLKSYHLFVKIYLFLSFIYILK